MMTQRQLLEQCVATKSEVELTLKSGVRFCGIASGVGFEQVELDLPWSRVSILLDEISAVQVGKPRREFRRNWPWEIEFEWSATEPGQEEIEAAWMVHDMIAASIPAGAKVRVVRLVSSEMGRILLADGVLEVSFDPSDVPFGLAELPQLLAAIF